MNGFLLSILRKIDLYRILRRLLANSSDSITHTFTCFNEDKGQVKTFHIAPAQAIILGDKKTEESETYIAVD